MLLFSRLTGNLSTVLNWNSMSYFTKVLNYLFLFSIK